MKLGHFERAYMIKDDLTGKYDVVYYKELKVTVFSKWINQFSIPAEYVCVQELMNMASLELK